MSKERKVSGFPDFVLSALTQDVINYTIDHKDNRILFIEAKVFDGIPSSVAKGKTARLAFSTSPSEALSDTISISEDLLANVTVSKDFMDYLLATLRDFGVKDLLIALSGRATDHEFVFTISDFSVRYDGPAGQWQK
jgi:hypothetical protein